MEIPGFYFDAKRKKYFKILPTGAATSSGSSNYSIAAVEERKRNDKRQKSLDDIEKQLQASKIQEALRFVKPRTSRNVRTSFRPTTINETPDGHLKRYLYQRESIPRSQGRDLRMRQRMSIGGMKLQEQFDTSADLFPFSSATGTEIPRRIHAIAIDPFTQQLITGDNLGRLSNHGLSDKERQIFAKVHNQITSINLGGTNDSLVRNVMVTTKVNNSYGEPGGFHLFKLHKPIVDNPTPVDFDLLCEHKYNFSNDNTYSDYYSNEEIILAGEFTCSAGFFASARQRMVVGSNAGILAISASPDGYQLDQLKGLNAQAQFYKLPSSGGSTQRGMARNNYKKPVSGYDNLPLTSVFSVDFLDKDNFGRGDVCFSGSRDKLVRQFDFRTNFAKPSSGICEGESFIINYHDGDNTSNYSNQGIIKHPALVTKIKSIRQNYMLVSGLDDTLMLYDLRFCRDNSINDTSNSQFTTPLFSFKGHFNHHMVEHGFDVDSTESYVAISGQDSQVRVYDIFNMDGSTGGRDLLKYGVKKPPVSSFMRNKDYEFDTNVKDIKWWNNGPEGKLNKRLMVAYETRIDHYSISKESMERNGGSSLRVILCANQAPTNQAANIISYYHRLCGSYNEEEIIDVETVQRNTGKKFVTTKESGKISQPSYGDFCYEPNPALAKELWLDLNTKEVKLKTYKFQ